jgi:hypothetical protein
MKTLKSMLAGIALLFICVAANATVKPVNDKSPKTDVIDTYIDAIAHGKITNLDNVLGDDMQYNMQRGENVNTLNKQELLDYLKNYSAANSTVTTNTTVITDEDDLYLVRIDFKYDDVLRSDVVTVSKASGWQITKVVTSFK